MAQTTHKTKILVVDDHPVIISAVSDLLTARGFDVCGKTASIEEAKKQLKTTKPALVVLDIGLPDGNGLDLIEHIKANHPSVAVLVYTAYDEEHYALRTLRAGASGFLMKTAPLTRLPDAILEILKGRIVVNEALRDSILLQLLDTRATPGVSPVTQLSDKELSVLRDIGHGLTTRQISEKMHLSIKTVQTYRERIKRKLLLPNATQLVRYAVEWASDK
ncbi:MAG: response regulator transcription factor [Elusimicrobia bacterium]|nr:response regulator transcription factor [Elusimicrobiota bacterium]